MSSIYFPLTLPEFVGSISMETIQGVTESTTLMCTALPISAGEAQQLPWFRSAFGERKGTLFKMHPKNKTEKQRTLSPSHIAGGSQSKLTHQLTAGKQYSEDSVWPPRVTGMLQPIGVFLQLIL